MTTILKGSGGIVFDDIASNRYPLLTVGTDINESRNRISNGNMVFSQRNVDNVTTHPSGTSDSTTKQFPADRFRFFSYYASASNVTNYTRTFGTTSATPEGHNAYIRVTNLTNTAVASGDYCGIMTAIEGFDFYDSHFGTPYGVPFVLSFWVRSSVAGTYCVSFRNPGPARSYVTHYTISANTWTKVYIPLPPCGDGTWPINNDFSLSIFWSLAAGTTFSAPPGFESLWITGNYLVNQYQTNFINQTAGQTFDLTGVCLEKAPQAALTAYVLRNTSVPTNGTTGLSLLQSGDYDDTGFTVSLPFSIRIFGVTSSTLNVSSNGMLGIVSGAAWNTIPSALDAQSPAWPHVGFFKGDKRLLTLYGGSRSVTQPNGVTLSAYVLRWEGYNYGGVNTNKTIVEFTFYQTSETYEGLDFFDVLYTTNANGTTYLELNPGHTNGSATGAYSREIITSLLGYRCYTRGFVPVRGTDTVNAPGVWWNEGTIPYNRSWTTTTLSNSTQYNLGVSSGTSKVNTGTEFLRCLRYFEKTAEESYVIPAAGNAASIGNNFATYSRFKSACSTTSYIPILYSVKRAVPTITLFNLYGTRGQVTLDNGYQNVTGYSFNASDKSTLTRVDYSVGYSHYGYYCTAAIDSDI